MRTLLAAIVTVVILGAGATSALAMPIDDPTVHPSSPPAQPIAAPAPDSGGGSDALLTIAVGAGALALGAGAGYTVARPARRTAGLRAH